MKGIMKKLKMKMLVWRLRLKNALYKIITPFKILADLANRYRLLRKIDKETTDKWERHIKIRELANKDELEARRSEIFCLKGQLLGAYIRASLSASLFAELQDSTKIEEYRKNFDKEKTEVLKLIEKLKGYEEISFDKNIENEILDWKFDDDKTEKEIIDKEEKFVAYLSKLDIRNE